VASGGCAACEEASQAQGPSAAGVVYAVLIPLVSSAMPTQNPARLLPKLDKIRRQLAL
jgi:hypothetical protein